MTTPVPDTACIPRSEAARVIGIPVRTLEKMVMRRELDAHQDPETGRWKFKPAEVERARRARDAMKESAL